MHVVIRLLNEAYKVIGIDNLNDYYDVELKKSRLQHIGETQNFTFCKLDLTDRVGIENLFSQYHPDVVINLALRLEFVIQFKTQELILIVTLLGSSIFLRVAVTIV